MVDINSLEQAYQAATTLHSEMAKFPYKSNQLRKQAPEKVQEFVLILQELVNLTRQFIKNKNDLLRQISLIPNLKERERLTTELNFLIRNFKMYQNLLARLI